jgi:hypothetical protein
MGSCGVVARADASAVAEPAREEVAVAIAPNGSAANAARCVTLVRQVSRE